MIIRFLLNNKIKRKNQYPTYKKNTNNKRKDIWHILSWERLWQYYEDSTLLPVLLTPFIAYLYNIFLIKILYMKKALISYLLRRKGYR